MLSNRYPATGGGVQVGIYHFFFILRHSKYCCLLYLQMARLRCYGQTIAQRVLCRCKKKRRTPGLCCTTVRGFHSSSKWTYHFFAYWQYSIWESCFQYSIFQYCFMFGYINQHYNNTLSYFPNIQINSCAMIVAPAFSPLIK